MFVYLFVGVLGLALILVFAAASSAFDSYRYKFVAFVTAALLLIYQFWQILSFDPSIISSGAANWNRIIFAQLLFAFPIIYAFGERRRIKARLDSHLSWE